jgi:hypothetical protein
MSITRRVALLAKTVVLPFSAGTIAMFDGTVASSEFSAATVG